MRYTLQLFILITLTCLSCSKEEVNSHSPYKVEEQAITANIQAYQAAFNEGNGDGSNFK